MQIRGVAGRLRVADYTTIQLQSCSVSLSCIQVHDGDCRIIKEDAHEETRLSRRSRVCFASSPRWA
jgi:hypothetical protein